MFSSSTNDSVLTVNGVASSSTYEQLLQNLVFTSAVSSSSANSAFADRSVTVILTDVDNLNPPNQASIKLNSDGSAGAGTQTITVKMQKTPPAFVKADGIKLLELTGDFGSNEAIKISLPGDSVSTPSAGNIDLATGSTFTSIINANVNITSNNNWGYC